MWTAFCSRLCTGDVKPFFNLICCPFVGLYQSTKIFVLPCLGIYLRSLLFNVMCGLCWPLLRVCCRFTDRKFKHDHTSLGKWRDKEGATLDDEVKWERATQYYRDRLTPEEKKKGVRVKLFEKGIEPKDVAQGQVGNCWLIAALACVAEHPGLVRKSFLTKVRSVRGKYSCRLFDWQKRIWVTVHVDEFIPLTSTDRQMLFAQPNGHELWVSMLEKAFAKFCGGYGALDGGQTAWALNALTGDPVFKLKRGAEASEEEGSTGDGTVWRRLDMRVDEDSTNKRACAFYTTNESHANLQAFFLIRAYCKRSALLGASFGAYKPDEKGSGLNGESMGPQGLVAGHAYSILDCMSFADKSQPGGRLKLIQLRNPWGRHEWTGPWADGSKEWEQNPKVRRICAPAAADDGAFWMSWEDFSAIFSSIDVCARSTGLRDINLDAMEADGRCRNALGPLLGCVHGCCCFWLGCRGCHALYFDVKADERTLAVDATTARDDDALGAFISSAAGVASVITMGKHDEHADGSERPTSATRAATGEAAAAGSAPPPSHSQPLGGRTDEAAAAKESWRAAQKAAHIASLAKRQRAGRSNSLVPSMTMDPWSVDGVIDDPLALRAFCAFCKGSLSDKNLRFILDAREWRAQWAARTPMQRSTSARALVDSYLRTGAEMEVSLPAGMGSFDVIEQRMFEDAIREAYKSLAQDIFPRFEESPRGREHKVRMVGTTRTLHLPQAPAPAPPPAPSPSKPTTSAAAPHPPSGALQPQPIPPPPGKPPAASMPPTTRVTTSRLPPIAMPAAAIAPGGRPAVGRLPAPMPAAWQPKMPLPSL